MRPLVLTCALYTLFMRGPSFDVGTLALYLEISPILPQVAD